MLKDQSGPAAGKNGIILEIRDTFSQVGGHDASKDASPTRKRRRTDSLLSDKSNTSQEGSVGLENGRIPRFEEVVAKQSSDTFELDVKGGFNWEPEQFSMDNLISVGMTEENGVDISEEKRSLSPEMKKMKRGAFQREKALEESIYQKELALLNPDSASQVDSPEDFDRLLFGSPNSSFLWLRYMAHFVKNSDIDKARLVAERALNTIDRKEGEELFNVWTGMLNLENNFGNEDTLEQVFERARKANDDELRVYKQLLGIYQNCGKIEVADNLCEEILKKFRNVRADVWVSVGSHFMDTQRPDRCRQLMQRAVKSLPSREHVQLLSRFAQMEFRNSCGDKERGKTIFESILASYPRKTDIWSVYIDMVVKYCSMTEARPLLERVTGLKLGAYQMRFLFKKWLELEERYGDEKTQKQVKENAVNYVRIAEKELIG